MGIPGWSDLQDAARILLGDDWITVPCRCVYGSAFLVVHPAVFLTPDGERSLSMDEWSVSHLPTGHGVARLNSYDKARQMADLVSGLDWDFTDIDACKKLAADVKAARKKVNE